MFRCLDNFRDHRCSDKTGYGFERHPVQSMLIGTPILTGSLIRLMLGIWADQYGGRPILLVVMISSAICTWLLTYADTYNMMLVTALGVGIAGGSFVVGISYLSKWYPKDKQGTALGIYGMGNIGAAVTKFCAPFVMVAYGWHMVAQVWAATCCLWCGNHISGSSPKMSLNLKHVRLLGKNQKPSLWL
jgi:nitrate/nitrite transporter NarK